MPTTEDMASTMISAQTIPINPSVLDYRDAEGKVILFVRDEAEGRSVYMGLELYGMVDRLFEVRYEDWMNAVIETIATTESYNNPLTELIGDQ